MQKTENGIKNAKRGGYIYTATLLLFLAVSLAVRLVLQITNASDTVTYAVSALFCAVSLTVPVAVCGKREIKALNLNKCSYVYIVPALLLAFGMLSGFGFLNTLIADGVKSVGGVVTETVLPLDSAFNYILFSVLLCVLPAVTEELFFRGVLLDSLSEISVFPRIITVALCFSLYHGNVAQLAYQFVYGAGLCVLTLKSKSVLPAIFAHFINNFTVLTIEYFKLPVNLYNPIVIASGLTGLIAFALFMVLYKKDEIKRNFKGASVKDFYLPFAIIGVVLEIILIILSAMPL